MARLTRLTQILRLTWLGGMPKRHAWTPATLFSRGVGGTWFDPSDLSTLFQERTGAAATTPSAVGEPVGTMLDKGVWGHHATAPSDAERPLLQQDGNGKYYLLFDGVDDTLTFDHSITAPQLTIAVGAQITPTVHNAARYFILRVGLGGWSGAGVYLGAGTWPPQAKYGGYLFGKLDMMGDVPLYTKYVGILRQDGSQYNYIENGVSRVETIADGDYTPAAGALLASPDAVVNFDYVIYGAVVVAAALPYTDVAGLNDYLTQQMGGTS
jgi:hypothetical protein